MRRSEINACITQAKELFNSISFRLPDWGHFSPADWEANPDLAKWCRSHQMGWDVTDYGEGDFARRGLILFCLRNGILRQPGEVPYAEKIMIVGEDQECPLHYHKVKMEDIIVRGGGNLVIELYNLAADGSLDTKTDVHVRTDGKLNILPAGGKVVLQPGQSVTLPRTLVHRFYGETGKGPVIVGEVSQVNDDLADNFFFDCDARFSKIEEDATPIHPLWNELAA
ncbi:D-lyxose/D-mannose family sugar isomerase [Thalassospira sp.]|uniref:D-lyxose/D-mannose family sugar isomerase n=1 Tax=Thalassospira sp. TaxID=1912094 RepID=UPI00273656FD|nr:D-lyxose/D-mannose family sugar isomerase [Thalassospira sp.]MDP2699452.1 D-lyxose/D-mannose family sugar isomerase [Thalassospira sp.]